MFSVRATVIVAFILGAVSLACAAPVEGSENTDATGTAEQRLIRDDDGDPPPPPPPPSGTSLCHWENGIYVCEPPTCTGCICRFPPCQL